MPLNKDDINKIIAASDFSKLVGEMENEWFDCKRQPYDLSVERQKMELSKDVTSFANYQGGYIFLGVKAEKRTDKFGDFVKEISPFSKDLVDIGQYQNVIKEWVHPEINNIEIQWRPISVGDDKGIIVIHIPSQKETDRPYLVGKIVDGDKKVEIIFGYFERRRDTSEHLKIGDLQQALKSGLNYQKIMSERFDVIEDLLKNSRNGQSNKKMVFEEPSLDEESLNSRINDAIKSIEAEKKRLFIISAYPKPLIELKTIFSNHDDSIRRQLEKPPYLRYSGWNINTLDQSKIVKGKSIEVKNGDRKVINLYRDGTMVFAGLANEKFLAWASTTTNQIIYSLSLIELTYEFVRFYKNVIADMKGAPEIITIKVQFKNMHLNDVKTGISPYKLERNQIPMPVEAPDNEIQIIVDFAAPDFEAGKVAYKLVEEIYLNFGIETSIIPYTKEIDGVKEIDPEQIKAI